VRATLVDAITNICETSFFAMAEPPSPELLASLPSHEAWYQGDVTFRGPFDGRVRVALPVALAEEMFAAFLGCDEDDDANPAEIQDVVGEFTNMVCGTWLTGLNEADVFALEHPTVNTAHAPVMLEPMVLAVNDMPVVIGVDIEAGV
jgi:CheY-specific phosphatase CheX